MNTLDIAIEKRYSANVCIRASLSLPAGGFSVTALLGPSGCGKTTTLRALAGLEFPERGRIALGGRVWLDTERQICLPPQQRGIGFLFQDYALFPHLTVERNIGFGLSGVSATERRKRVAEILELLQLSGLENRYPRQLSGGEQQRVALARSVVTQPELLLLDEPLSALDTLTREQVRRELRHFLAKIGKPTILVTHDRVEALALADHIVVMSAGTVLQSAPVEEVFSHPASSEVARIVGVETVETGVVGAVSEGLATVEIGGQRLTAVATPDLVTGQRVYVCIRAEDVILQKGYEGFSSPRNRLQALVRSQTREGPLIRVALDCGFQLVAVITSPAVSELKLRDGDQVTALVKAPSIHLVARK
jgi:molybdate transport system ATP-binding protein